MVSRIIRRFNRARPARPADDKQQLLSSQAFQAEVARERLRCDRSTIGFSLLTIEPEQRMAPAALPAIVDVVSKGIRETDTAGWLSRRKIGIILPYTPADGAWILANKLTGELAESGVSADCNVYVYPSQDLPEDEQRRQPAATRIMLNEADSSTQPMEMLFVQRISASKRLVDILGAGVLLLAASPVMLLAALGIKLTSRGPIFFSQ
ncbi:MAG TPA: hypothetical protein VHY20_05550, partial [Pirellulales bacterium]|nr:hypothetical protein [Pirellulales bacterium]